MSSGENKLYLFLIGLVVLFSGIALFNEIMEPDGALYAAIAKTIVLRNDWLNLYVRGTDWLDKPHLTFWLAAASYKIFGISAFAYKLPSFLITLMGAWYLYLFAKDIYGKRIALISTLIFLTALHNVISNFDVRAEGYLTGFVIATIYHYYKAQRASFWHIVAGSFFAACAIMIKGIFVLIPVIAGFIIYWLFTKQAAQLLKPKWWLAIILILVFISPELYALYTQFDLHPEKVVFGEKGVSGLKFFFWDSQFGRFFNSGPIKGKGDVSFFIHTTLWAFLPWAVLFYAAIVNLFKKKNPGSQPPESIIIWSSALATFLVFSFSKFQLPHYIIIIFPQFSIITAYYLTSLQEKALKVFFTVQNVIFCMIVVLLIGIALLFRFEGKYAFIALILVISLTAFTLFKRRFVNTIIARGTLAALGLLSFLYLFFYPALLNYQSGMQAARWLNQYHPEVKSTVLIDDNAYAFDFYAHGEVKHITYSDLDRSRYKAMIVYTPEAELGRLKAEYHGVVLKEFAYYRITKLKGKFLNFNTRPSTLERYYLVSLKSDL